MQNNKLNNILIKLIDKTRNIINMTTQEIYDGIKKYFTINELVGKRTVKKYGERAWRFLDHNTLHALLIVREGIGKSITVNSGNTQQRGLRTNIQQLVRKKSLKDRLYISAHIQGKAFDFDVKGMTAEEVRNWCVTNSNLFPVKIRLEHRLNGNIISWVHLDTIWEAKNPTVYLFDV